MRSIRLKRLHEASIFVLCFYEVQACCIFFSAVAELVYHHPLDLGTNK
jgi:hypothetical protein